MTTALSRQTGALTRALKSVAELMFEQNTSNRAVLRALIVFALAAFIVSYSLPDLRRIWQPVGNLPFSGDADNVLTNVSTYPASGGLKVGDRIDIRAIKPEYRVAVSETSTSFPGQAIAIAFWRGQQKHYTTVVSKPEAMDLATQILIVSRELAMLLFVGIGAALVILRPSIPTWAFYFFCLGLNGAPAVVATLALRLPWSMVWYLLYWAVVAAGFVGVAVFSTLFLHKQPTGWRKTILWLSPLAFVALFGLSLYWILGAGWFGWPAKAASDWYTFLTDALVAVALFGLVSTYLSSLGTDRQRIRWVVLGFAIVLAANAALSLIGTYFSLYFVTPYWFYASLKLVGVVVPITVAYAVIRHRVIDVSFVVSRTLVYAVLTTMLVGIFSLIDWFFTDYLRNARLGTVAEVVAVLAFGFWFNTLHRRVDALIDATFFRHRHRAEVRLARAAVALPLVTTSDAVAHFLVQEPVYALSLASAALFRRGRDGVYRREDAIGWESSALSKLDTTDEPTLALARAEAGPLSLFEHPWGSDGLPTGAARPILAMPITVRRELEAIAFYGSHLYGEALDPDEIRAIAQLAPAAAIAYEHLEAEAMRRRIEAVQSENDTLRSVIAEFQIQPT